MIVETFVLSDSIIYISDVWILILVEIAYLLMSFLYTRSTGHVIYPFLTWKDGDYESLVFTAISVAVSSFLEIGCAIGT